MTLSRRVFLAATGTAALAGSYPLLAAKPFPTIDGAVSDTRPMALLMMGHDHDPALSAGVSTMAGPFALGPVEKPEGDELYSWIQTQCDRLSGYRLAAMTDDVGALMLTLALRDRAAPMVLEGHHAPAPHNGATMTHRLNFFGGAQDRAKLGSALRRQGWCHPDVTPTASAALVAASHHDNWAFGFGMALAEAFTLPAQDHPAATRSPGTSRLGRPQASRSILADI